MILVRLSNGDTAEADTPEEPGNQGARGMTRVTVTGPEVDRRADSPAVGLSAAITFANRATRQGVEATFYVRDDQGDVVGRTEADGHGGVLIYGKNGADRASASVSPPSPTTGPPTEVLADGRPEPVLPPPTEGEDMGSPAEDLHGEVVRVSAKQATVQVLKRAGGPLKTDEIVKRVLRTKGVALAGKTPAATIGAMLSIEGKKPDGLFVRTDKATYGLRESKTESSSRSGGRKQKAESASA